MRDAEIVTSELYTLQLEDDVPLGSGVDIYKLLQTYD